MNAQEVVSTEILNFTADDFYNSSAPFEWLYQFNNNKFLMNQMREKLKQHAASLGVKGFIGLWNSFLEIMNQKNGISLDNATDFEGQEMELFSGQYICDENGVVIIDRYGYDTVVCRHPIMPVQRLVNIDTGEEHLKIAYKKGKIWRNLIAEKTIIASNNQILKLAASGILVNSENAKLLSTYLFEMEQLNYEKIPEEKSVSRLGWVDEGFSPYVDGLVFDGEKDFKHMFKAVSQKGDRQKWIEAMIEVRKEKGVGRLFLAVSFASVLLDCCGLLPFFFHAWGGTETGKSVGLKIAASVWANPKMGEYISTFNSTFVGQEMMAAFLNSLPLCLDELQIQSSGGVKDFDKMIYQLTEGIGKTRGAKTGGLQKINTWRNCIITTGEHPISNNSSGGGAVNRVIEFECLGKTYHDMPGLCDIIDNNYGFAGKEFIEFLQQDGAKEFASNLQKEYYRQLLKFDSTEKQASSASAILVADTLISSFLFNDGNQLTVEDLAAIMTKKQDVDVNERALDYIMELIERNPTKFTPSETQGEIWGRDEISCVYIIKSVFNQQMLNEGFNPTAFLSWAKRKDILICEPQKNIKKARIGKGAPINCVCLKRK